MLPLFSYDPICSYDEGGEDTSWEAEVEYVEAILCQSPALSSVTAEISAILRHKFVKTQNGGSSESPEEANQAEAEVELAGLELAPSA